MIVNERVVDKLVKNALDMLDIIEKIGKEYNLSYNEEIYLDKKMINYFLKELKEKIPDGYYVSLINDYKYPCITVYVLFNENYEMFGFLDTEFDNIIQIYETVDYTGHFLIELYELKNFIKYRAYDNNEIPAAMNESFTLGLGYQYRGHIITQYEPISIDKSGYIEGGYIKVIDQRTLDIIEIENDNDKRNPEWFISGTNISNKNPELVIQKAVDKHVAKTYNGNGNR